MVQLCGRGTRVRKGGGHEQPVDKPEPSRARDGAVRLEPGPDCVAKRDRIVHLGVGADAATFAASAAARSACPYEITSSLSIPGQSLRKARGSLSRDMLP